MIYGCHTCGVSGLYVNKVKKYAQINGRSLEIKDSKHDKSIREEHTIKLKEAGLDPDNYQALVIDGNNIVRLREWKP
jgi:hypothetical protein